MTKSSVTRLDKFDNSHFKPGSSIKRVLWLLASGIFFQTWFPWPSHMKALILKSFGAKIGKSLVLKPRVNIKYPWKLTIGDHVWIGEQVWIDNLDDVTLGNHVCISQGALLLCGNHNYKRQTFDLITGPIILEDGVWIGAQSTVAPGITCHSHSILTLGSIATADLNAFGIYQGNPASFKKQRTIEA